MRFYTWKDIERYILMHHDEWKDELYDIEVYPNEMVVYPKSEQGTLQNAVLKKLFPKNIAPDNLSIKLDGQGEDLMILYEYEYSPVTVRTLPLFKKAIYEDSIYPTEQLADLSCPVFAFHSYKGGVGRTLSLIAFARAWTNLQKNPENSKLLIIDSDLEAPGLTLIQGDLNDSAFSYLDLLTLIQDNSNGAGQTGDEGGVDHGLAALDEFIGDLVHAEAGDQTDDDHHAKEVRSDLFGVPLAGDGQTHAQHNAQQEHSSSQNLALGHFGVHLVRGDLESAVEVRTVVQALGGVFADAAVVQHGDDVQEGDVGQAAHHTHVGAGEDGDLGHGLCHAKDAGVCKADGETAL